VGLERSGGWRGTTVSVPPGPWRNLLSGDDLDGGDVEVGALLARFPVALLERP
jgi:(1->4)-alpha-D-glucan 1-alpha-D-glucosylmutase